MLTATCLCKQVSFEIHGDIHNARYCHCSHCRKFSGTAYAAWGVVGADDLEVTSTNLNVTKYNSGGGLRVFCSICGSPLWFEPENLPALRGIPLGVVDDAEVSAPAMHVWTRSMVAWMSLPEGTPQHETHP
jgi:hypothetical protein